MPASACWSLVALIVLSACGDCGGGNVCEQADELSSETCEVDLDRRTVDCIGDVRQAAECALDHSDAYCRFLLGPGQLELDNAYVECVAAGP